jgi:signal transduction histidine kinase
MLFRFQRARVHADPIRITGALFLSSVLYSSHSWAQGAREGLMPGGNSDLVTHVVHSYGFATGADFYFSIQAILRGLPILQNEWFRAFAVLAFGISIGLLARTHLRRRIQHVKGSMGIVLEERNRIAQECHDTLMAGFSAISWQLEATMNLFRDSDEAQSPAAKSCELARSMVLLCQAEARRIIYDLRETEEVTSSLSKALLRMLEENHHGSNPALRFDMEGDEVSLSPGSVHHLACITQEAVRNALRHAEPKSIHIQLIYEAEVLRLSIRDDGRGFQIDDAAARTGHFGIAVMHERVRKVGGSLRLHSDSFGTHVEATVPFDAIYLSRKTSQSTEEKEVVQWIGL